MMLKTTSSDINICIFWVLQLKCLDNSLQEESVLHPSISPAPPLSQPVFPWLIPFGRVFRSTSTIGWTVVLDDSWTVGKAESSNYMTAMTSLLSRNVSGRSGSCSRGQNSLLVWSLTSLSTWPPPSSTLSSMSSAVGWFLKDLGTSLMGVLWSTFFSSVPKLIADVIKTNQWNFFECQISEKLGSLEE